MALQAGTTGGNVQSIKNTTSTSGRSGAATAKASRVSTSGRSGAATAAAAPQGVTPGPVNPATFDNTVVGGGYVAPDVAPELTDEQYLQNDLTYQLQKSALDTALNQYINELNTQRERYNVDYGNSLRKLGFTGDNKVLDTAKWDTEDARWEDTAGSPLDKMTWNETDQTTASGRGFTNALNDFAARGMLQSSAYARALNNLSRSLNEQLSSTATARNNQFADWTTQEAAKRAEDTLAQGNLSRESLARIKAAYGIG